MQVNNNQIQPTKKEHALSFTLNGAVSGAVIGGGTTTAIIAGDRYLPAATRKLVYWANFSKPPSEPAKSILKGVSTKAKVLGVAAFALISAVIGAILAYSKKDSVPKSD